MSVSATDSSQKRVEAQRVSQKQDQVKREEVEANIQADREQDDQNLRAAEEDKTHIVNA